MKVELYKSEKTDLVIENGYYLLDPYRAYFIEDEYFVSVYANTDDGQERGLLQTYSKEMLGNYDYDNITKATKCTAEEFDSVYLRALEIFSKKVK